MFGENTIHVRCVRGVEDRVADAAEHGHGSQGSECWLWRILGRI